MPSVKKLTFEQRFWAKVDRRGPDECWPWKAAFNEHGYGVMRPDTTRRNGPTVKAHRVSAQLAGIQIDGMKVLHSCDNPPCVNPAHLRPGTMQDNSTDMVHRDRNQFGEACAWSRLTEASVREIKLRLRAGARACPRLPRPGRTRAAGAAVGDAGRPPVDGRTGRSRSRSG